MTNFIIYLLAGLVAIAIFIYLIIVLINAEKF